MRRQERKDFDVHIYCRMTKIVGTIYGIAPIANRHILFNRDKHASDHFRASSLWYARTKQNIKINYNKKSKWLWMAEEMLVVEHANVN